MKSFSLGVRPLARALLALRCRAAPPPTRWPALASSLFLLATVLAGCATHQEPRLGTTRPTQVYEGEEFFVTLNIDRESGYGWRLMQQPDPRVVRVISARYEPPSARTRRGHDIWTCQAVGRGTTRIVWHYLPRGDTNQPPARIFTAAVEVR